MMKNLKMLLYACSIALTFVCNNTEKAEEKAANTSNADTVNLTKIDTIINGAAADTLLTNNEPEIVYADSIDFAKYKVAAQKRMQNAPIDWNSYPDAKAFETRISEAYKEIDVDFAGHYITSVFGCGASCIMGFMVDVRDGKIYDLPLGEENSCFYAEDRALYHHTSRLFIAGVCKENIEDTKLYYIAYLWDEDKKEFEKIEVKDFLKK